MKINLSKATTVNSPKVTASLFLTFTTLGIYYHVPNTIAYTAELNLAALEQYWYSKNCTSIATNSQ